MSIVLGEEILFESPDAEELHPFWKNQIWNTPYEPGVETPGDYQQIMRDTYEPVIQAMLNNQGPLMRTLEQGGAAIRGINRATYPFWRTQQAANAAEGGE